MCWKGSVDEITRDLRSGEWMSTPHGAVHAFNTPGTENARVPVMLTPDVGVQFFRDVGALAAGGAPDKAELFTVMGRYGLVPAAPRTTDVA